MPTFPHESTHWYARIDQWSVESVAKVYYYAQGHAVNDVPIRKGGGGTGLIMTPISQSVTLVGSVATLGTPAFTISLGVADLSQPSTNHADLIT
jgi:hypothetical protein